MLSEQKRPLIATPQISRRVLEHSLQEWLGMYKVHMFIRPLMSNVVMVDLDDFKGKLDDVLRLQPRALVQTSAGLYQLWLTVQESLPAKTA